MTWWMGVLGIVVVLTIGLVVAYGFRLLLAWTLCKWSYDAVKMAGGTDEEAYNWAMGTLAAQSGGK